jgi:hypothetical protein
VPSQAHPPLGDGIMSRMRIALYRDSALTQSIRAVSMTEVGLKELTINKLDNDERMWCLYQRSDVLARFFTVLFF